MSGRHLEMTFRKGRAMAAYLYLPRQSGDHAASTRPLGQGLVADFAADGRLIGLEVTDPARTTLATLNAALATLSQAPLSEAEARPLAA
ncbi:MAG: DUF2283 domain-containing protein [Phycisphaerales bacterium]